MSRRRKKPRKPDKDDLRSFQRFRGTLGDGTHVLPVRFKARIRDDGEVELDLHAFRITRKSRFIHEGWRSDRGEVPEFTLSGTADNGLRFESDSLSFNSLNERYSGKHNRHWSKPRGELGKVQFLSRLDPPSDTTALRLRLKGFACFPALYAECPLGKVQVAGATTLGEVDELTGYIVIEADGPPPDPAAWRADAERLAEHLRRILSFAASTMLQAPVLEYAHGDLHEVEVLSQTRQHASVMRVFHKLDQQRLLEAALASFFDPPIEAKNLFFAIEWFAMATTYNEVRLVNAMTALENLIDSNLNEDEALIEPKRDFDKIRKVLRKVIGTCLAKWAPDRADAAREELGERLLDLNRRPLRRKLYLLAARWGVPLEGISDAQIGQAIRARNAIVHTGHHPEVEDGPDLWHHMTIVRELVVRFLLTAIGYRGQYISHVGGYHFASFPLVEVPEDIADGRADASRR
jgi:hypothetical protein